MDEVGDQPPEITVHIVKTDPDEQLEPDAKRVNFIGTSSEQVFDDDEQNPSPIVDDFYEPIDPSEPSTSSLPVTPILRIADKFQFITNVGQNGSPPAGRNRLRAPRNTSLQIAEAAQKNGMQTVNRSGSRFVVPITMQAHPTPLTDRLLDERDDILSQQEAYPYCILCNCIIKTWRGFEYHVLRMHIKYRAFRCFHCQKESFYTEEEGRFHLSIYHPGDEVILLKEFDMTKETAAQNAFKHIYLMCRDGFEVTKERVLEWETESAQQVMKFQHLRFKRPVVLVKKPPCSSREAQTEQTIVQPIIHRSVRFYQNMPLDFHQVTSYDQHLLPGTLRPRSTATQRDEDPRDREKRIDALMHAVTSSHD